MRIVAVGAGHVAHHLFPHLAHQGHTLVAVCSRSANSAQQLAARLAGAEARTDLHLAHLRADLVLLAVSDDALPDVVAGLHLPPGALVAHTSGSVGLSVLAPLGVPHGVFYPLQTFSRTHPVTFDTVPLLVEGSDAATESRLLALARQLSRTAAVVSSAQRQTLHVAAVMACNFTNHLWALAEEILATEEMPFEWLEPLVRETVHKAFQLGPLLAQTGPASRGDATVVARHLAFLRAQLPGTSRTESRTAEIYQLLSESIAARS